MKSGKEKKNFHIFLLFLEFFGVIFAGFCACNAIVITLDCIFDGFDCFWTRVIHLPFLLYLCLSLGISLIVTFLIHRKTR